MVVTALKANALAIGGVLLSAFLYTLCFPPFDLRLLAALALLPHFLALRGRSTRDAALLGVIWGFVSAWGITYWLPTTVSVYYHQPYWLGLTLFSSATLLMVSFEYAVASVLYAWASRTLRTGLPFVAASAWVAAEFARAKLLTGNPWGFLGYSQAVLTTEASGADFLSLSLSQIADLGGVYAVSFVLVASAAALADAVTLRKQPRAIASRTLPAFLLVAFALVYGSARLASHDAPGDDQVTVAVVQPNLDLGSQWREDLYGENLRDYLEMTLELQQADPAHRAELVVWPENAMTFFIADEPLYRSAIARVLTNTNATLVAGAPYFEKRGDDDAYTYYNSAFAISPEGRITGRYDKQHLLPFAEYFPLATVGLLNRNFGRVRQFSKGADAQLMTTPAGRAGSLICNEAMFGSLAGKRTEAGAELLILLSNDSWVGDPMYGRHQLQMAVLRAIEQRRDTVRASTSGPSAIIDASGRIKAVSQAQSRATLSGSVQARSDRSSYSRVGDAFAWGCLLIVGLLAVVRRQPRPR